jgi:hypothetical protein
MASASPVAHRLSQRMIVRMVRAVLLGVLATVAVTACGKNDAPPAAQPGAVAGKVLEVTGAVSVAGKPLAVGDAVKTDDVVETGADGNVVIELAHNQARWELGPNHKVKPSDSLAWTAAKKTGSAAQVDQTTSAAGRPAERSAADTEATTRAPVAAAPAEAKAAENQPSTGAPAPPPPPAPPPKPRPSKTATPRDEALPQLQPSLHDGEAAPGGGGGDDKASKGSTSRGGAANPALQLSGTTSALKTLSSCVPAGSSVHIKAHIASHVPTISFVGDVDAAVQKCIRDAAPKLTIAIDSGDVDVTLTR